MLLPCDLELYNWIRENRPSLWMQLCNQISDYTIDAMICEECGLRVEDIRNMRRNLATETMRKALEETAQIPA